MFEFTYNTQGRISLGSANAKRSVSRYARQQRWFSQCFVNASIHIQKGYKRERLAALSAPLKQELKPAKTLKSFFIEESLKRSSRCVLVTVEEVGCLKGGLKKRQIKQLRTAAISKVNRLNNQSNQPSVAPMAEQNSG